MNNNLSNIGGVHFEIGRGYRASVTVKGTRIRSQRVKSERTAKVLLNKIRRALGSNLNVESSEMVRLQLAGTVSITL